MSNSFFDWPASGSRFANFNVLTGDDLNDALDSVSTGLDKLPTPAKVNGGYANYAAATGSANAYVVSLSAQITALADGLAVRFKANAANTGAATINVNSLGAKSIVRPGGAALEASDIASGQIVEVCYDSTNDRFQLQALVSGAAAPASTFSGTAGGTIDLLTGAAIASAATINLTSATGNLVHITGTTTITAVTLAKGPRTVIFDDVLTLTHHATNNNLPGGANITTAAGDRATYWSDGTTVYCLNYERATGNQSIQRAARTSNTVLGAADRGKLIDITSGTFSQTFAAAPTLTAGWYCYIRNSGTGDITLEPDGSEQIDGLTNFIMYPGEVRLIQCDGSALRTVVLSPFARAFTASGTFTKPPGYSEFDVEGWGSGGGGGSGAKSTANNATGGGGGGGGAYKRLILAASAVGTTETVTIAAGGSGGAAQATDATAGNAGSAGGNTSLGSLLVAYGGAGGPAGSVASSTSGGGGGGSLAAATTAAGGGPVDGDSSTTHRGFGGGDGAAAAAGGSSAYGGGAGGGSNVGIAGAAGGCSAYGGGGGGAGAGNNGDLNGGAGGSHAGVSGGGGAGGVASSSTVPPAQTALGYGGGGGYHRSTATAGASAGAAGGPSGGGGGGAGGLNATYSSGGGGAGGRGELRVRGIA